PPPLPARECVPPAGEDYRVEPKVTILRPWMLRMAALFDRTVRELIEMLYQLTNNLQKVRKALSPSAFTSEQPTPDAKHAGNRQVGSSVDARPRFDPSPLRQADP